MSTSVPKKLKKTALPWQACGSPEQKLSERGAFSLSDTELLAMLLRERAKAPLPQEQAGALLLRAGNNLSKLAKTSVAKLSTWPGMTLPRAYVVASALELARRLRTEETTELPHVVATLRDVRQLMRPYLKSLPHEEFWALLLSQHRRLLGKRQISQGGLQATVADPKLIFRQALSEPLCTALILVHNHPSGDPRPSDEDKALTRKLLYAGRALELQILDYIIYTDTGGYSFAEEGLLDDLLDISSVL